MKGFHHKVLNLLRDQTSQEELALLKHSSQFYHNFSLNKILRAYFDIIYD